MSSIPKLQRPFAAVFLGATAAIHAALVPEHLREAPYAGALFIALSVAALALAVLLLVRTDLVFWTMSAALVTGAMAAYLASRSVGLPSLGDDVGDWLNPLGIAAVGVELAAASLCARALRRRDRGRLLEP